MNDAADYSVRKPDASHEVWGVGRASDQGPDAQARDRAKRNADRRKRKKPEPPADEAPAAEADVEPEAEEGPDGADDGHTVDHLA